MESGSNLSVTGEILWSDQKRYRAVISIGTVTLLWSSIFESVLEIPWCYLLNQTEQYFPVVLCIVLYVQGASLLTFESVDEIPFCHFLMQPTKKYFHLVQFIPQVLTKWNSGFSANANVGSF